jgi:ribosomal protein S18 acetylase RimI-like enzyme
MLQARPGNRVYDFLWYEQGILVGYLALMAFMSDEECELVSVVHPDFRRRGIFRALLEEAKRELRPREGKRFILTCEHSSQSGQACVRAVDATLDFSEHEMVLGTFHERLAYDDRLVFQAASSEDLPVIASLFAIDRHESEENSLHRVQQIAARPRQQFYLATFGDEQLGCHEPVGTLRLLDLDTQFGIYGFIVHPDYRGRGYGRQMLQEIIHIARDKSDKPIMLDVDVTNERALGLYRSVGFETRATYDYYVLTI